MSEYKSCLDKQQSFYKELKQILVKYDAELCMEDFSFDYDPDYKIVVDFKNDEKLYEIEQTSVIPQLLLGRFEDGK